MLTIMIFDSDKEDDVEDLKYTLQGKKVVIALGDFGEKLRYHYKHKTMSEEQAAIYHELRDLFWETMEEHDVKGLI